MSETQQRTGPTWERIHENQQKNSQMIFEAGLRPELIRPAVCPVCGSHENALYWTVTRRIGRTLFLRCPICEKGTARYKLDRNRSVHSVLTRAMMGGVVGLLLVVATLYYYRDSAPVQLLVEEMYEASATLGGNTGRAAVFTGGVAPSSAEARGLVYVAAGDRRHDLDRYAAWIVQRHGERELRRLLHVQYSPQRAETRVVVDSSSLAWPRRLHRLRGWQHIE